MTKNKRHASLFFLFLFFLGGCQRSANREIVIDQTIAPPVVIRFDKMLFSHQNMTPEMINTYRDSLGAFLDVYVEEILNVAHINDPALPMFLDHFRADENVDELNQLVGQEFRDFSLYHAKISDGLLRYSSVFNTPVPKLITFINGFNYYGGPVRFHKIVATQEALAIGLDMYLSEHDRYDAFGFPKYLSQGFAQEYIIADALKGWVFSDHSSPQNKETLIEKMIDYGRCLYMTRQLLMDQPLYAIMGYTKDQMQWCEANEKRIWQTLIEQKLLYEKTSSKIDPFLTPGPFTKDFPKESPAQAVFYLGLKIVESYMQKNTTELVELMQIEDLSTLLTQSSYNP